MNITDLIVELLQQGKQVELPGMGTFGSEMQPPYHDSATGTYYPARRTLTFSTATTGDTDIVQALAQRECVGENVARQMWKNYTDALTDKMQRTGSHSFGELGTLNYDSATGYSFTATPGVVLSTGDEKPLEGVRTYAHNDNVDPFAQFDDHAAEEEARKEAERKAEEERLAAERKAEEERLAAERKAEEERLAAERKAEEERLEAERREAEARAEAERKAEEERAAVARIEAERLQADKEAAAEREAVAAATALAALNNSPAEAKEADGNKAKPVKKKKEKVSKKKEQKEKKKRRFPWWLLLLLLLLLLLGGAAYWYFMIYRPAQPVATTVAASERPTDVPLVTDLTYNTDLLQYGQRDIDANADQVCRYMEDYIYSFLAYRHYGSAMEPMMERVRQYVGIRLSELMADRFAVQRLYPFNDYIYKHNEPYLHQKYAAAQRVKVQGELLNMRTLDDMLNQMVSELGLEPDAATPANNGAAATPAAANTKGAAQRAKDNADEAPVRVNIEQNSKQGFDIIAGFYLDLVGLVP